MSALPHDELEELITADSLDGLDEAQHAEMVRQMATHGPDCLECRRLTAVYADVAGRIAMSLEPAAVSSGAEDRLLIAARSERPSAPPPHRAPLARVAPTRARRWIAAAAVAAALAVLGGVVGYNVAPRATGAQSHFFAFVSKPGTRIATFPTPGGQQLAVAFRPGQREAWVIGTGVASPPGDRVYELWFLATGTSPPQPAGTVSSGRVFVPSGGRVLFQTQVGASFAALAVSEEPPGGSLKPTKVLFVTKV